MLWASIKGFEMDLNHGEGWEDRGCRDGIGALGEGNRMGGWVPILNGLIMAMGIQYCSHDKNCNGYQSHTAMAIDGTYAKEEFTYEI